MSNTSNLQLLYLAVGQAQKHVTVNETLRKLDAIIQLSVVSATISAEPATPADGDVYIIPSGKSGAHWSAFANWSLGYYRDGAWVELTPREGWLAFVRDADQLLHYTGSAWALSPAGKLITVSASDRLLGRVSSGSGAAEEVVFTDQAQALCDDTSFSAMRTTLGAAGLADANTFTQPNIFSAGFSCGTPAPGPHAYVYDHSGAKLGFGNDMSGASYELTLFAGGNFDSLGRISLGRLRSDTGVYTQRLLLDVATGVLTLGGNLDFASDNANSLGTAAHRASVVYAATGTINTSDALEKTSLRPFSEAERRAVRRIIAGAGMFQWRDAIASKGETEARLHAGITAQDVAAAFQAEGLDPARYGVFCADSVEDGEKTKTRLGVRYDQLFAMALAALAA